MPEPIPLHARQPRGPAHPPPPPPPPPPPTDPRLLLFPLLPGEDGGAWARHAGEVLDGLAPVDGLERKLAAAVAVGMWRECRADRIEAEVLTDIGPSGEDRGHGSDLWEPAHVAALTAALRCQTAASIATGRALRLFLAQRKARATGLLGPMAGGDGDMPARTCEPDAPPRTCEPDGPPRTREPDTLSCTSEPERAMGATVAARTPEPEPEEPAPEDPDAWLARCPVVEADPSDESLRRALLGTVEHEIMREMIMGAPLKGIEQFVVGDDAVAYEEWFAKQPKPDFPPMDLPESWRADILHVTRDNPPWARGEYLGYYRKPVPRHLFDADMGPLDGAPAAAAACTPEPEPAPAIEPTPDLKARIARLLDRKAPRLPEELDLAEAICAVKWPKWPAYQGKIDLVRLRDVLKGIRIDAGALNWLGGREIQKRCREAARGGGGN